MKTEHLILIAGIVCLVCVMVIIVVLFLIGGFFSSRSEAELTELAIRVVQEKCEEYAKLACENPVPKNLSRDDSVEHIDGGSTPAEGAYPHMGHVFLQPIRHSLENVWVCGSSILDEYFVMTAASCIRGLGPDQMGVSIGAVKWGDRRYAKFHLVDEIFTHEKFDISSPSTRPYDIAVLKLKAKINFDWSRRPICLNTNYSSVDVKNFTFTGYGADFLSPSRYLQCLEQFIDEEVQSQCSSMYKEYISNMICARHFDWYANRLCEGDSGGSLQIPLKKKGACANTYEQIGIASNITDRCPIFPTELALALYTRVDQFTYWIASRVWPEKFN